MIEGEGSLTADGNVKVGGKTYEAGAVILATGSVALPIPGVEFSDRVVDTWGAWSLPAQPKSLAVVGAGASGSEIASAYGRYGTEVILVEMLDQILPLEDKDCAKRRRARPSRSRGSTSRPGPRSRASTESAKSVKLKVGDSEEEVDYLVHRRRPRARHRAARPRRGQGRDRGGGRIKVDEYQRTSNPKVYAIGDLVRGPALAHKASEEGVVAAETIAGAETHPIDLDLIPGATFCHPQVASVGMTEAEAKEAGNDVKVAQVQARRRRRLGRLRRPRRAWSRSSPTPSTARSSAPTSSATGPAT